MDTGDAKSSDSAGVEQNGNSVSSICESPVCAVSDVCDDESWVWDFQVMQMYMNVTYSCLILN